MSTGSGGGGGGGAPADATYITQTPNASLSNEQALSTLATGLLKVTTATGVLSSVTTSAGIAALISDETGTGALVFATSPTLVTPVLGVASATSINKVSITAPATSATLTIADGKTLTVSNTLTFTGTDSSSVAFGAGGTVAYVGSTAPQGAQYVTLATDATLTNERVLTGTASQVLITDNGAGSTVVLSLPQSIATSSTPQFAKLGLGAAADASRLLYVTGDVVGGVATFERSNAATNTMQGVVLVKAKTSGSMADDFGAALNFALQDTDGVENTVAGVRSARDGADNSGSLIFTTFLAGVSSTVGKFSSGGDFTLTPVIRTTGSPTGYTFTQPAHTTLTASVEAISVNYNISATVQFATGALTTQRAFLIQAPTYGFVGASTITTAVTVEISGAPIAGTNATITNSRALRVVAGTVEFGGNLLMSGATTSITFSSATGTPTIVNIATNSSVLIKGNLNAATASGTSEVSITSTATRTAGDLFSIQNNGTDRIIFRYFGGIVLTQGAGATGTNRAFVITNANHTNQTTATEIINFQTVAYTRQWAAGSFTTQRENMFGTPTYAFVSASTITNAATLVVQNSPQAGTNATITNSWSLWVQNGTTRLDGLLDLSGIAAGSPNMSITATSDTPGTTWNVVGTNNPSAAPSGFLELIVGGNARYIPFYA